VWRSWEARSFLICNSFVCATRLEIGDLGFVPSLTSDSITRSHYVVTSHVKKQWLVSKQIVKYYWWEAAPFPNGEILHMEIDYQGYKVSSKDWNVPEVASLVAPSIFEGY
jgi:hypothetical protein